MSDKADETQDDWLGRRVGNYTIQKRLGAGGMGVVYVAEQASLGRQIALKVLRRTPATAAALIERFKREAQTVSRLAHPNVVTVFDFGQEPDLLYFAMELVAGETLRARLNRKGRLTPQETLPIIQDIAAALAAAHAQGIIHRDLKPENVMLVPMPGRAPLAKVLDFGIARVIIGSDAPTLTGTGSAIGTPAYIAPETMVGERDIDGRADLYAVGVMWFEMLTGRLPFTAPTPTMLAVRQLSEDAPRVSSVIGVPQVLDDLIAHLLARDPSGRPADANDLLVALNTVEAELPPEQIDTNTPTEAVALAETLKRPASRPSNPNVQVMHKTAPTLTSVMATKRASERSPALVAGLAFAVTLVLAGGAVGAIAAMKKRKDPPEVPVVIDTRPVDSVETQPIDGKPVDGKPVDANPVDTKPVGAIAVDTKPTETAVGTTEPTDVKPADVKPTDAKPTDAKPTDAKPTDASPTDANRTAAKPTDAKHTDAKHGDKPTGTKPAGTKKDPKKDPKRVPDIMLDDDEPPPTKKPPPSIIDD